MEMTALLQALEKNTGTLPRKALEEAGRRREEITPELLRILEDTIEGAQQFAEERSGYFAPIYAMYLLAQFRETQAYPLVVQFARLPGDILYDLTGDFITEDFNRVLASVCGGDTTLIESLIEDREVDEYARSAAIESLKILVAVGAKPRDEIMAYYKALFEGRLERPFSAAWNALVSCATRLHPKEVYPHIVVAFELGLVQNSYLSLDTIETIRKMDSQKVLDRLSHATFGYIDNVVGELETWHCFNRPKKPVLRETTEPVPDSPSQAVSRSRLVSPEAVPAPSRAVKVKPNEPCPCGSGKKHKKCCGQIA